MVKITIELIPHGIGEPRTIGEIFITNDGSGTLTEGNYDVVLNKRLVGKNSPWRRGRVEKFPRQRLGPYDLLYRALKNCIASRNP